MREYNIRVKPFNFLALLECSGVRKNSEHGVFRLRGVIEEDKEKAYLSSSINEETVEIFAVDQEGTEKVLMKGIVTDIDIETSNGVKTLYAEITTRSILMDVLEHIRTYQNPGITYSQIVKSISANYPMGWAAMTVGEGKSIPNLLVQYKETDWEFLSRLASHFGTELVPHFYGEGTEFWFGMPKAKQSHVIDNAYYSVKSNIKEYETKKQRGLSLSKADAFFYVVREREIFDIGDNVILNGIQTKICEIYTELAGSELYHTYSLKAVDNMKVPKSYNERIIGASLHGRVLAVQEDTIQLTVDDDENKKHAGVRWFPYSTVYSSPDGTGWYCMPEIGDAVRLYLPCENEKNAYAVSSTHLESSDSAERVNPDYKSLMNKYGKEVLFTPGTLIMTNNAGMSVEIIDDFGVRIISDKAINISSQEAVSIASGAATMQLIAKNSIVLKQGETIVTLSDLAAVSGAQVKIG